MEPTYEWELAPPNPSPREYWWRFFHGKRRGVSIQNFGREIRDAWREFDREHFEHEIAQFEADQLSGELKVDHEQVRFGYRDGRFIAHNGVIHPMCAMRYWSIYSEHYRARD